MHQNHCTVGKTNKKPGRTNKRHGRQDRNRAAASVLLNIEMETLDDDVGQLTFVIHAVFELVKYV